MGLQCFMELHMTKRAEVKCCDQSCLAACHCKGQVKPLEHLI